ASASGDGLRRHVAGGRGERLPRVEIERDPRPTAGGAADLEVAAEQTHPLPHPGKTELAGTERARHRPADVEAASVVHDRHLDVAGRIRHTHSDVRRMT